jgi:hypothetical protein
MRASSSRLCCNDGLPGLRKLCAGWHRLRGYLCCRPCRYWTGEEIVRAALVAEAA